MSIPTGSKYFCILKWSVGIAEIWQFFNYYINSHALCYIWNIFKRWSCSECTCVSSCQILLQQL